MQNLRLKKERKENCLSSTVSWFSTYCKNKKREHKRHLCLVIPVVKGYFYFPDQLFKSDIYLCNQSLRENNQNKLAF